jgi:single-strand DNA-binding protein
MSALNLNKVILGGHLTTDPELKQTPSGVCVTTFSIAVNRRGKNNEVDFINCVAWRNTAEFVCKYFKRGSAICIVGAVQTRSWSDNNGNKRYATEVVADEAHFVDSKSEGNADAFSPAPTTNAPQSENIAPSAVKWDEASDDTDLPF